MPLKPEKKINITDYISFSLLVLGGMFITYIMFQVIGQDAFIILGIWVCIMLIARVFGLRNRKKWKDDDRPW